MFWRDARREPLPVDPDTLFLFVACMAWGRGGSSRVRSTNYAALRSVDGVSFSCDSGDQRVGLERVSAVGRATDAGPADRLRPCGSASISRSTSSPGTRS